MFELFFIKRYLWPKRKNVSTSLIGCLSLFVIAIVVWLLLLFLSITEGIEKIWLSKLTSINAPVRITPTDTYYNSYYYQIDSIASASNYTTKTIREKLLSSSSDPYQPELDEQIPSYWKEKDSFENGLKDPVKKAFQIADHLKTKFPSLIACDYQVTGALMRLELCRAKDSFTETSQSFLSQVSYIAAYPKIPPSLQKLIQKPTLKDLYHLLYLSDTHPSLLERVVRNLSFTSLVTNPHSWRFPQSLLPENASFEAFAYIERGKIIHVTLPTSPSFSKGNTLSKGTLSKQNNGNILFDYEGKTIFLEEQTPIFLDEEKTFSATLEESSLQPFIKTTLQNQTIQGTISWKNVFFKEVDIHTDFDTEPLCTPPWAYFVKGELVYPKHGAILPKQFRDNQVLIGDRGTFSFQAITPINLQEQQMSMQVVGFYDPGVISIGARFLLVDPETARTITAQNSASPIDPLLTNGIALFFENLQQTPTLLNTLKQEFEKEKIDAYWQITPYYQYDFAKELISQFRSDRHLFLLVGILILIVACSNIISLLLLLVNDKKHEIATLLSLGAKKKSLAIIFGGIGAIVGFLSSLIGLGLAYYTLSHIDFFVGLLGSLEGSFHPFFPKDSLPHEISLSALLFVCLASPLFSLIAGLIPAIKAYRLQPLTILRPQ